MDIKSKIKQWVRRIGFKLNQSKPITISEFVKIGKSFIYAGNNSIGSFTIIEGGVVEIGKYTSISTHCVLRGPIKIGNHSQLGPNVSIFTRDHPINSISINVSRQFLNGERKKLQQSKEVRIGHDVWIGAGVVILKGVTIGNGAVIAAGAVVSEDIPDFAIAVGIPAKIKRYRFSKVQIKEINKLSWWDWSDEKIENMKFLFEVKNIEDVDMKSLSN